MSAAKLLVTLVIIFVSLGLISLIYNGAKRTLREGFEKGDACPKGCSRGEGLDANCSNRIISNGSAGGYYRDCKYHCPGPYASNYDVDQQCSSNEECRDCGSYTIPTDPNGYALRPQNTTGGGHNYRRFDSSSSDRKYSGTYTKPNNLGVPVSEHQNIRAASAEEDKNHSRVEEDLAESIDKPWKTYTTGTDTSKTQATYADDHQVNRKQPPLYEKSSHTRRDAAPRTYTNTRTNNMLSYNPIKNNLERKEGWAFAGETIGDNAHYTDLTTAADLCNYSVLCGGINLDITTGEYSLMSVGATLEPRHGFAAYVKKPQLYGGIATHYGGGREYKPRRGRGGHGGRGDAEGSTTWTVVASITPSFGNETNNQLSNGSLTSAAGEYKTPHVIDRRHYQHYDVHRPREDHETRHDDYYREERGERRERGARRWERERTGEEKERRDERYQIPDHNKDNAENGHTRWHDGSSTSSLESGKPPETPYTMFAPTNKPRSPYLKPRPYNSLMDLFR